MQGREISVLRALSRRKVINFEDVLGFQKKA